MKISQTKEAKAIRRLLGDKTLDQKKIWNIITALRGPDEPKEAVVKWATTALIRGRLGVKEVPSWALAQHLADSKKSKNTRAKMAGSHFRVHIIKAFNALNLEWNEVNE